MPEAGPGLGAVPVSPCIAAIYWEESARSHPDSLPEPHFGKSMGLPAPAAMSVEVLLCHDRLDVGSSTCRVFGHILPTRIALLVSL